mmetsp:Transcript_43945/g.82118  ORF Transcript_43945/g.82118 Transcript_43945/m.82118 type:complete len:1032 (-) Transcript_43945:129-3224(-)
MSTIIDMFFEYILGMSLETVWTLLSPVWVELSFVIFFALGFVLIPRVGLFAPKETVAKKADQFQTRLWKAIEADAMAGHSTSAVKTWRKAKAHAPTHSETLKLVVQSLIEVDPDALVQEITGHMSDHRDALCNSKTAATVLDVVARAGRVTFMEELQKVFYEKFRIQPSTQIYEVLLGGYASAGEEKQVAEICSRLGKGGMKISARGYSLTIKGFLKNSMVDPALKQILDMNRAGFTVPSFAITQLIRAACEVRRGMQILDAVRDEIPIPSEAVAILLEDCLKRNNLPEARKVEQIARGQTVSCPFSPAAYDSLLKICVLNSDLYALELFDEMQKLNVRISEGLCVGLLARCADTRFLRFAEEIVKYVRAQGGMSIAVYSALMKVYAYSGMYAKACDLYDQIVAQGMQPDSVMYGCLMKFAVECGRTDLSRDLFSKVPSLDIQNYMSLIRAAGRDKDIERAFQVLQKLKESDVTPDVAAYNCVLDVCVGAGDLRRGRELMTEMRALRKLDVITYNTLLKGLCGLGDIRAAKELLLEMESAGMPPNDVSYNCLINAAVSRGLWQEAWNTVDLMEGSGLQVDRYTLSIIMKALKKNRDTKHVARALALLDKSGLDPCSDEVLLNTVLETCIRHHEHRRIQTIIDSFYKSNLQPSVHTYGSLIKACGSLTRVDLCWGFWFKMVDDRAMEPNDIVLGCMLDALVCNERSEDAVSLFKMWQPKIPPNTIMYCTLIKGFANSRQAFRAMDIWREMREVKMPMNTVVYNALIDSQARVGLMDEVSLLVQHMEPDGCSPDVITYSTIVKGYCYRGNLDQAFEVLRNMQHDQMANDSVIYNTLLDGCVRHNRMDLADKLLEDMKEFSVTPSNFTLGILVKMWGRRKRLDKAFKAFEEIPKKHGFKANAQAKTCLMCACLNNHDLIAAVKVFDEVRASEHGADWRTYGSLISGTMRHGQMEQAVALVQDAYGLNPKMKRASAPGHGLETECLEQLLRTLAQRGQMKSLGVPLLNQLRAARVPLSGKLLSAFTAVETNIDSP